MRKKGANGQESRARLLIVAANEFAKSGYHQTKISTIVSRAGLTQPSFYLYFESKEAIFRELMEKFRSELKSLIEGSRLESGIDEAHVTGRLLGVLTGLFTFLGKDPDLTQIGFFIGDDSVIVKAEMAAMIEQNLKEEQRDGYFDRDSDMHIVAECLVGVIERLTSQQLLTGKRTPEDLARHVVSLFMHGISIYPAK
ncbi:TetR/AcrR family transcriptional regulator [Paenibacillus lautus]|uniref:TetR/AcrR family transcriptional regulator n=1 Tax=Paenibacillus lautus TaxID=1401 RepID=A0A385TS39_PAELA|nr:TetR/AcrR family transcriptional regulator [Paenibacillus lautus]AYB45928.1 TetR/AcrR family transcriptional regulator [Paenibacillus lautus]MCI1776107.1 TetR/AcrR family transcriptional regulator [Paenibacillus lautus]VTR59491.1 Fatty acid metabolism regulator protein [Actinobacillus pleuropneumoniae]